MYCICLAPQLLLEGFNPDGGCVGTHKVKDAMRFDDKLSCLEFIRTNNLTAGARPVLLPPVEQR